MRKNVHRFLTLLKNHKLFLIILLVGVALRLYKPLQLFMYSHDQDLLSWFVKDVVYDKDLRLIGQETSVKGVFIGPLFYYAMIPFYLISGMDPTGGILFITVIGAATILSIYYICSKMYSNRVGLIASFLYSISFYTVMTDREVVPTTPVILWSVWLFYCLHLFLQKKYKHAFLISGLLIGLVWHVSMGLALTLPLLLIAFTYSVSKRNFTKSDLKYVFLGTVIAGVLMTPFFIFELRHNFQQIQSILSSSSGVATQTFAEKLDRTISITAKNIGGLLWGPYLSVPDRYPLYLLIAVFSFLIIKRKILAPLAALIVVWHLLFIVFFSRNALNLSEYYLNGMLILWIVIFAIFLNNLTRYTSTKLLSIILIAAFFCVNIARMVTLPINRSGYVERRALVAFVKADAAAHGYPCVSVSYITEPGFDFGYRYLYFIENMHVNQPSSQAPVYTVVFPHSRVDRIDESFGALGLIRPDYEKYNPEGIASSCAGENSNVTDPLFGYVQ